LDLLNKLYIEPTSKCNLNCEMCFRNTWFDESFCDMQFEIFEKILNTRPTEVKTVFFGGMGEPLFHPNIIDMITMCKEQGLNVELLSNGILLTPELSEALLNAGLNKLWVSLDSLENDKLTEEEPINIGHPDYHIVVKRIEIFNRARRTHHINAKLGITFVATKSNVHQLALLPYFIDRYMVNEVNVSNMYPSDMESKKDVLYERTLNLSVGSDQYGAQRPIVNIPYMDWDLKEVQTGLEGLFSKMNFNLLVGNIPVPRRSQYCRFIQDGTSFVRSDGNVSPCMALLHNGTTIVFDTDRKVLHHSFGNIKNSGLKDIWESNEYADFRERVRVFSFSPCMNCGHCSFPESNQEDCYGNVSPTCGGCLWAEGLLSCP